MDKVKLYTMNNCPYCTELKMSLQSLGIDYVDVNVNMSENEEEFTELIKKTRSDDVPVVIVDKNILAPNVSFKSISELVNLIVDLRNS